MGKTANQMKDTTQTQDHRSSREIQKDIREVRGDMDHTLDSLNDRLSPRSLINGLLDWFEKRDGSSSQDLSRKPKELARFVRDNPVPALLTGVGVAWLIAESQSDDDESDFDRFRVDHDPDDDTAATGHRRNVGKPGDHSRESGFAMTPPASDSDASDDEGKGATDMLKDKLGDASDAMSSAVSSTRDKLSGARDQVASKGGRAKSAMQSRAARGRRSASRASDQLQRGYANAEVRFKEAVDDYPLGIGAGFVGLGLLAGLFLPRSEAEDEWFGESADDMKDAVTDKGEELLERGKDVAGRVADEAADEAERQGLTADNAASALESVGKKVGSVVEAAREEGKEAAQDEHLTPEDLKSEAHSEADRTKDKAAERVGSS
jgi:hypothetical protein